MTMYLVIKVSESVYRWALRSRDQNSLLMSIAYPSKAAAHAAVVSARIETQVALNFSRLLDPAQCLYFVLRDAAGVLMATSELFSSEPSRDSAIELCSMGGQTALLMDIS